MAKPSTAVRVKHRSRAWFVAAGIIPGVSYAVIGGAAASVSCAVMLGCALTGLAAGAWLLRDRCSACGASLPLRVFDESCASCGAVIVGVEDDGRQTDLPTAARRGAPADRPESATPYRAGSVAARDAAEAALDAASRTDVDARKKRLREDPKIARALRDHDEHALVTLILERRKKARSIAEEAALDALLADPRRHLEPKKRPWLGARASSGLVLSAPRDHDADDGSFVAEQLLVLGGYSIVPLASYVVRRREKGVEILGRVPLPFWKRLWRAAVALPVAAGLALGAQVFAASRVSNVHLINALDIAVTVSADGETMRLAPGARDVHMLAKGRHHLVAKDERGATIEEQDIDVPGGSALVVYNMLGASPIVAREVFYSQAPTGPNDLQQELFVGQRVLVKENVEYPFVDALREIPGRADLRTWQVTQLPGGWQRALAALRENGHHLEAITLAEAVSMAEPENEDAVTAAVDAITERYGAGAARAHLEKLAARSPGSAAVRSAQEKLRRGAAP